MKTAGDEGNIQFDYLYLLALRGERCDTLFLFYAPGEEQAERQAVMRQKEQEALTQTRLQRVELRRCPYGFTAGLHTFWPPTCPRDAQAYKEGGSQ